jgi:hypothetical protein
MISLSHRCAGHQFRRQGYGCGGLAVHDLQEEGNHFGTDSCEALSSRWIADRTTWRRAESSDPPTAGVSAFNHPVMGDQPRPNFTRIEHLDPKVRKSRPYCFHVFGKRFSADSGMYKDCNRCHLSRKRSCAASAPPVHRMGYLSAFGGDAAPVAAGMLVLKRIFHVSPSRILTEHQ